MHLRLQRGLPQPRDFHVRLEARESYGIDAALMSIRGELLAIDMRGLQRVAAAAAGRGRDGPSTVDLYAGALSHELLHAVAARLLRDEPGGAESLAAWATARLGEGEATALAEAFRSVFPPQPGASLEGAALFEELLLLRLHNRNPAMSSLRELISDDELAGIPAYARLEQAMTAGEPADGSGTSIGARLLRALEAPQLESPDSLEGQLRYLLDRWGHVLADGEEAAGRILLALDMLAEQNAVRLPGPGPASGPPAGSGEDVTDVRFASDAEWMREMVITARNCLVWLAQLSRKHGLPIERLDQVPESELAELAAAGFTGLWLIGIWERSRASREIKRLRGQGDAEASAYALEDYVIAGSLGGGEALERLRGMAWNHGIRLVSDMVPNHTGLDSRWVREHPERFVQLPESPFPDYSFNGPDLSSDPRVSIHIEDGYWDGTDAAVVFRRTDAVTGDVRYLYHGNDGTTMPWNDTAQIDFLDAETREAVIREIVGVARRFPVIRFDAAMTLVRRHVRRLWHPEPGHGGAIPSRAVHGVRQAGEFDRRMPAEFWSEAVARVEREVPGTLMIAEAFWMLEDYFVRHLGMHRVYNSAFMHMLRDMDNHAFTELLRSALLKDPRLLARYVNFMSNPDEDSSAAAFGTGDRYLAVCTLLATLPGLPLFGHGQVEGLTEKYGMEFGRPRSDELPDQALVDAHQRLIFPLLRRRAAFTGTDAFELFSQDAAAAGVIAFSNVSGGQPSVVAVNNSDRPAAARLEISADRADRPGRRLAVALGLSGAPHDFVIWRDHATGSEHLMPYPAVEDAGLSLHLGGYGRAVLLDFRVLASSDRLPLDRLYARLGGTGVPDVIRAAGQLAWQSSRRSVRLVLQGKAVRVPVRFPSGEEAPAGDVLAVAMQRRRLQALARHEPAAVSTMWRTLDEEGRLLLRLQGTGAFEGVAPSLLQRAPAPPVTGPGWWSREEFRSWLAGTVAQGGELHSNFLKLAALQVLGAALAELTAGGQAADCARRARFEWARVNRAARLSGGDPGLLLAALDAPRGGSGPGQGRPPHDGSGGPDQA